MPRLFRYATVQYDPENCLTVSRGFAKGVRPEQLTATAMPFLTICDACFGYCKLRKAKGRLDQHSNRIQREKGYS